MPLQKQPLSLQAMTVSRVGQLANTALDAAQVLLANDQPWQPLVQECQDYFRRFVPNPLWSQVFSLENVLAKSSKLDHRGVTRYPPSACLIDSRIVLAFISYDKMFRFILKPTTYQVLKVPFDYSDIARLIPRLHCLLELDIQGVCISDDVLVTLSESCLRLEKLSISTRTLTVNGKVPTVTENGLLHLSLCKELVCLKDADKFVWASVGCCADLLLFLPKLESFNCVAMLEVLTNVILDESVGPLKLNVLSLYVVNSPDMVAIAKLCPDVQTIELNFIGAQLEPIFKRSLRNLAKCSLRLSALELGAFHLTGNTLGALKAFLLDKGKEIRKLVLDFPDSLPCIDVELLLTIGETCPGIKELEITSQKYEIDEFRRSRPSKNLSRDVTPAMRIFLNLTRFHLSGFQIIDFGDLLMVLKDARKIVSITVEMFSLRRLISLENEPFWELFTAGVFDQLENFEIVGRGSTLFSPQHLQMIVENAPNLSFLGINVNWSQNAQGIFNFLLKYRLTPLSCQ